MITEYPLTKANRLALSRAFYNVPRVDMSIECAIEGQMGRAACDDLLEPTAFKIYVGPFFYLTGDATGPGGQAMLASIMPYTLFMPSAPGWIEAAQRMYGERLVGFDRYSFSAAHISAERLEALCQASAFKEDVRQMDLSLATRLWGQDHFVDLSDFDSAEDFTQRGVGFYLEKRGKVVGAAYSSLVCSQGIEVSLFVDEDYRRRGVATILACRLLQWSLAHQVRANWDAANPESCKLAEKIGYVPTGEYRAYYLREA